MAAVLQSFPNPTPHSETKLRRLNAEYIEAFLKSDTDWYARHLAEDFRCILPNGEIFDRAAFMADAAAPVPMASFDVEDVSVQFDGDTAIVQARAVYQRNDGHRGQSRYTDVWVGRDGRWQVLTAQITPISAGSASVG